MLFSKNRFYRQAEQSDKHLLVNAPANLMVDSRGVVRPFGIVKPSAAPTAKPLDRQGALRRDVTYSYLITHYDSYNDAESEPSPATDFVGLDSIGVFESVGFAMTPDSESPDFAKILVAGSLNKEPGYYSGQSIAVEVTNNDRKAEYSQWQYRKIIDYQWDYAQDAGVFTLSRPLVNVDSDPDDRRYRVKLSDIDCEEGVVGGKSSSKDKLILDSSASADVGSYRLKLIRITAGKGKGQSRLIADAVVNSDGLIEVTLAKPWKTKPKFVDPHDPEVQKRQAEWKGKNSIKTNFFNKWFSSEYMIYDPMRHSGLCIDGEVTSYDKKTGLYVIDGLGNGSAILSGQVVRFVEPESDTSPSCLVISLENANVAEDWASSDGLIDKTIRITSGPGSGATYVIVKAEKSGENSISLSLSSLTSSTSINGTPNSSSTYVIFSSDAVSSPELRIGAYHASSLGISGLVLGQPDFNFTKKSQIDTTFSIYLTGERLSRFLQFFADPQSGALPSSLSISLPVTKVKTGATQSFHSTASVSINSDRSKVTLTVSNTPSSPYEKKFKALLPDNFANASLGTLVLATTFEEITYDPLGDDSNPGFKIYVESLDALGLDLPTFVPGSYSFTFSVSGSVSETDERRIYRVTRPIVSFADAADDMPPYIVVSGNLPLLHTKDGDAMLMPVFNSSASVTGMSAMEGFYTGWKAFFYNPDNDSKPKLRYKDARVAGYFDATGSILLDTKLAGVGPGWQVVLYSEYSRCLGSAVAPYDSDEIWLKKSSPVKYYQDYVPLEPFASSEEADPETGSSTYEGWTLKVLSSSKTRKNGKIKYLTYPDKKVERSKRTIVKYFPLSRRAYVYYKEADTGFPSDVSQYFNPGLDGSEHLWLYDESSAIDVLFNEDTDSSLENAKSTDYGCRILVTDIRPCPYAGVDKIRLYRASETTNAYHLVATLDNKLQDYEDNTPEEDLTQEIDTLHTTLPPCGVCTLYKGRFVAGGIPDAVNLSAFSDDNPSIAPIPSSFYALFPFDYEKPIFDGYTYSDGASFNSKILRVVPALITPFDRNTLYEFPVVDALKTEKLNVSFIISVPSGPGLLAYASQEVYEGRSQSTPVHLSSSAVKPSSSDFLYLSRDASSDNSFYNGCRVTVTNPRDGKSYSRIIEKNHYTGRSRCLSHVKIADFYSFPDEDNPPSYYPSFPVTIDRILWKLEYKQKEGDAVLKYYYSDVFSTEEVEVTPSVIDGPNGIKYLSFGFTANQGTNYSTLRFLLGGALDTSIPSQTLGRSTSAKLLAFTFADTNNTAIESFLPALGKLVDDSSDVAMYIPGAVNNNTNAVVYSSESFSRDAISDGDDVWRLAIFDKYNSPYSTPGTASIFPKSNGYTVYVCSPTRGDTEKVQLSNTFTFADDLGDRITGLYGHSKFIIVFKERGIYALEPDEPAIQLLHHDIGCISPDSIASGRSGVYWLSADRRILRSSFSGDAFYYASKEIQPWLDGDVAIDDEWVDGDHLSRTLATYDADSDEYMVAFPTKAGKWLLFAFCDKDQTWFRIYDHSGSASVPCSENAFNCLFKHHGRASFCSDFGLYTYSEGVRPDFFPWKYASTYLTESNSGIRKLVKRIQIINLIDKSIPSDPIPSAYFEFYRDMTDTPEESYQQEGKYTRRFFDTNKYVQFVHVGIRSLMWNFIMYSSNQNSVSNSNFVSIHDLNLHFRNKHDDEPRWNDTPYSDPPVR